MKRFVIIGSLTFLISCTTIDPYSYVGKWERDGLTWINREKHLKITFPSDQWRIYTRPSPNIKNWKVPRKGSNDAHYLMAMIPGISTMFQIMIETDPGNVGLEDYMRISEQNLSSRSDYRNPRWEITERKGQKVGFFRCIVETQKFPLEAVFVIFKEMGRFTLLVYATPRHLFQHREGEFWQIVDSYEYLRPGIGEPQGLKVTGHKKADQSAVSDPVPTREIAGDRWALIIGISAYEDSRIPRLRYADRDAKSFYDWLTSPNGGKYSPARVKLLLNRQATLENIKDGLFVWLRQPIREDVITIYYAGHGSAESPDFPHDLFLFASDTQYENIATTAFPMWDIETAIKRFIKAKKIVIIADACHAAGVGQSFDVARRAKRVIETNPISTGLQNLSRVGDGICVISASDERQFSQESKDWGGGHGVFTHFLLKGLKGEADYNNDEHVTLGEVIPYLSEQVRRATKNAQSPTVAGKFDPALSIGR
jgi:hypothetical protein